MFAVFALSRGGYSRVARSEVPLTVNRREARLPVSVGRSRKFLKFFTVIVTRGVKLEIRMKQMPEVDAPTGFRKRVCDGFAVPFGSGYSGCLF